MMHLSIYLSIYQISSKKMSKFTFTSTPYIILFLSIFFNFATLQVMCSNNETDLRALVAFKNSIDNETGALNTWNETVHFCSWQGIVCSHRHKNRVVAINLMSQGLMGSIPPHLGNLSFLRYIDLQNNSFHGQIPDEIGCLRRLEYVEFSNNSFSGEIPRNLSQCTNMYYLNLIDNHLTGIIPPELSSLMKLEDLGLTRNRLSGTIPPYIGNFTHLLQLSMSNCGLHGEIPDSLVQLKSLEFLYLYDNSLTGKIPLGLFNSSDISVLILSSNRLQGTIPSEIGFSLSKLTILFMYNNLFTGEIPVSISNISSLSYVELSLNSFTRQVKIDFSRLQNLKEFALSTNSLEGDLSFISSMVNCTGLEVLDIENNLFSGSLPNSFANLSRNLFYLRLNDNQFHGIIPSGFGNLLNLELWSLSDNDLDGSIPYEIGNLNKLQELELDGNKMTNEIPFSLGNLTRLGHLNLSQNNLAGNIPHTLANCSNLLALDLSRNNLNGMIPRDIMSLSSISISFDISYNALSGSIPIEVGALINLARMDLSHNRLSGVIPDSLSNCIRLETIKLENNSLSGEIPDALKTLRGVQYLDLSQNNLSGEIPKYLCALDLLYLNLSFNRLEGEIPTAGVFLNNSAISLEGNNDLCGGIPSLNFRPCSSNNPKKQQFPIVFKVLIPVFSAGVICITALTCFYIFVYNKREPKDTQSFVHSGYWRLSYADLLKATSGFSEANLLGKGNFGVVYKGILNDGQSLVAIKVLNLNIKGASKSFLSECNALRGIRHRNLVKMVSVCSSTDFVGNDFKALVYEYMANGDLDQWLHQKSEKETKTLSLRHRLNIAVDIASALEYLHFGTDSVIVHGDMKPSNILLDEEMGARLGDFGLAKIISSTFSTPGSSSTGIKGTIGYIPPEYGMSGMISTEGDVYSYGILLLEMITGRRPTDDMLKDSLNLHVLVGSALPSKLMEVVDPIILRSGISSPETRNSIASMLEIGVACSRELPGERITMRDVVNRFRQILV